jgi:hypothetical protein
MADNHIRALQSKHAGLEREIHAEETRPSPDMSLLADLKRRKLRLKDEMSHG